MGFAYTWVNGERVAVSVAADFARLKAAFERAFPGLTLVVSSGTRTWDEQNRLYLDYVTGRSSIRAANPDDPQAYHVETNPTGPRAIDIADTGSDAGVTRYGNGRSDWIAVHAREYGFDPRGYREFNEPWHLEWQGVLATDEQVAALTIPTPPAPVPEEDIMIFIRREATNAAYAIIPGRSIKHVPSTEEEQLTAYALTGQKDGLWFKGLNDADLRIVLWNVGLEETQGDLSKLPVNGGIYYTKR